MLNIKKLDIKKPLAFLLAGAISFTVSGCKSKELSMHDYSFDELINNEEIKNSTILDELIANHELDYFDELNPYNYDRDNYLEMADELEKRIAVIELLNTINFSEVDFLEPLSYEERNDCFNLSLDEIQELIDMASRGRSLQEKEEQITAFKKLKYIKDSTQNWINNYGDYIYEMVLKYSLKASIADECHVSIDDVVFPTLTGGDRKVDHYIVHVNGEVFTISDKDSPDLWNAVSYYYFITTPSVDEGETDLLEKYKKALNFAKEALVIGSNRVDDSLQQQYSLDYIKEKIKK